MKRLNYVNLYGPEVFEESLIDPLKTMKRDILPRFIRSPFYEEMTRMINSLDTHPLATELELPIPPTQLVFESSELTPNRQFRLSEIVENRYLYSKFMAYLQECYCSENLICYRMVTLFEEKIAAKHSVKDISWDIYRFFVAEGSPFEISLEYSSRKAICLQLAKPTPTCYDDVKKSAYNMLKTFFASYKNKPEYQHLSTYLLSKQGGKSAGCIPFAN